jgi:hypothetical protein
MKVLSFLADRRYSNVKFYPIQIDDRRASPNSRHMCINTFPPRETKKNQARLRRIVAMRDYTLTRSFRWVKATSTQKFGGAGFREPFDAHKRRIFAMDEETSYPLRMAS